MYSNGYGMSLSMSLSSHVFPFPISKERITTEQENPARSGQNFIALHLVTQVCECECVSTTTDCVYHTCYQDAGNRDIV